MSHDNAADLCAERRQARIDNVDDAANAILDSMSADDRQSSTDFEQGLKGLGYLMGRVAELEQAQADAARWRAFAKTAALFSSGGGKYWYSGPMLKRPPRCEGTTVEQYGDALIASLKRRDVLR